MSNLENFRISSALKNLIGKELITDQYIAVFELVKNSFDAYATKVTIIFENLYDNPKEAKIIINDDGKGMNYNDLNNKWLFVAYSAKIDGTEDISKDKKTDYRDKIRSNRIFAGAKGVGRFSCDRLGEKLNLVTIKDEPNAKVENLIVNWEAFEEDQTKEFVKIDVIHKVLNKNPCPEIKHGTILEISGLRDKDWNRKNLLKLKHSLEKLINPNQENDTRNFSIELVVNEEKLNDKDVNQERDKVNGQIKNFVFETLEIKTTQIKTEITNDANYIKTELIDRGRLIYRIKEKNSYALKSNITIHLFQLNRSAKMNFKKIMGIDSVSYGSIFLYKNGFRIYPFGEQGEDILQIDRRKQQGYRRFLGTRDLIGRIEINDIENIDKLKESTSRDGGIIKNKKYNDLVLFFYDKALKRLENYVVNLIRWGDPFYEKEGDEEKRAPKQPDEIKKDIIYLIANLAASKDIVIEKYNKDFLDILDEREDENLPKNIKKLSVLADKTDDPELQKRVRKVEKQFREIYEVVEEQKQELVIEKKEKEKAQKEVEHVFGENLFLRSITSTELKEVISLQHHIERGSTRIERNLDNLKKSIEQDSDKKVLFDYLEKISIEIKKISTLSRFITKANFNTTATTISSDLIEFITEYIENVYRTYDDLKINNKMLKYKILNKSNIQFNKKFKPLEIIIIIDNLIDNSQKNGATLFKIEFRKKSNGKLELIYSDDGKGVKKTIINRIFDFGFTTTPGSGMGLYHIKKIIESLNGKIFINSNVKKGVEFIIEVPK